MDEPVIVIGGGICGLMCAAALARHGRPVQLLESTATLGGRAETSEQDGFLLNRGAHALYPSAERLLGTVGVRVSGGHPNAAKTKILAAGETFGLTAALSTGRGPLGLGERRRVGMALARTAAGLAPRSTALDAAAWCEQEGQSALAAGALMRLATYAGDLSLTPTAIGRRLLAEGSRRPVRYLDCGWRTIVEGLRASATAAGAVIRCSTPATALATGEQGTVVEVAGGSELRCEQAVLAGLSPTRTKRLLESAGATPTFAVDETRVVRAACLDVALSSLPVPATTLVIGADEPLYLSVHSACSRLAPPGGAVIHLLRYDDGAGLSDAEVKDRLCGLLDLAQPGWRERLVQMRFAPRMVAAHHLPAPAEGLPGRPGVSASGLPGVHLAGDWVGPEGWLAGAALASGAAAAEAILSGRVAEPDPGGRPAVRP
jgi:phytoene dehydrogenase-like protein